MFVAVSGFSMLVGIAGFAIGCFLVYFGFKLEFSAATINQQMVSLLHLNAGLVSLLVAVCAFGVMAIGPTLSDEPRFGGSVIRKPPEQLGQAVALTMGFAGCHASHAVPLDSTALFPIVPIV